VTEPALLDTHQHLIFRNRFRYSWTESIPALAAGDFSLQDYWDRAASAGVDRTLFMESGVDDEFWQDETRYLLSLAGDPANRICGVIAGCRPESDAASFDAWLDETAETKVVGFRRILHVEPDELSTSGRFVRNVRELGKRSKTFDLCFLERQLPVAVELARRCDNTQLVLDHCGVPDIQSGDFERWRQSISRLAELPNVVCKLSGIVAYCPSGKPLEESVRPYVAHCIDAFGFDRLVWGSDWPVCNTTSDLTAWASIFRNILAAESTATATAICRNNAVRTYRAGGPESR
jgi:predicted TIM-barrel fold metal-dependent hydrolase